MKEIKLNIGGLWGYITAIIVALIISGSAVFISTRYNETQKAIANTQAEAEKEAAKSAADGMRDAGKSIRRGW